MARRGKWVPKKVVVHFETVRESEFAAILAELGELIYGEISTRQVRDISSQPEPIAEKRKEAANE